jgi:hypothetical protein
VLEGVWHGAQPLRGLRRAAHLLATLRSPEARATIELAAADPDDSVRKAAEESLTRPQR